MRWLYWSRKSGGAVDELKGGFWDYIPPYEVSTWHDEGRRFRRNR
jgi:hypothetical protein